jgi:tetratricopeptide (TPR) repeat protein
MMSFLRKMLGLRSAAELKAEADALLEGHDPWAARPLYERAMDRAGDDAALRSAAEQGMRTCQDRMAQAQIDEGDRHAEQGDLDLARQQYEGAAEIAHDDALRNAAERKLEGLERAEAVEDAAPEAGAEPTDEDRLEVIASTWEPDQADEYDGHGEALDAALLALADGRNEEGHRALEALLEDTEEPRYIWYEVGRARLAVDDHDGGADALRRFIDAMDEDEGGEARLVAHLELARLLDDAGDFDAAVAEHQAAIEALGDDPRPYLWLGRFLRAKGHPEEAAEVIESALEVMDTAQPDWRVLQELGLAQAEAGQEDEAIETLEQVLKVLTGRRHLDFPPPTALTLAKLCEKKGRLERAADLYRLLTKGSDRDNLPVYYREGARVLAEMGLTDEARRMLQRASALTEDNAEAHAEIARRLAALEQG